MSAVVDSGHQIRTTAPREPVSIRIFYWSFDLAAVAGLVLLLLRDVDSVREVLPQLLAWGLVIALADSLPVRFWGPATLTMSLPVTLAVGMLFDPLPAALIALVASLDPREIKGEVSFARALFNRSQIAVAVSRCIGCVSRARGRSWTVAWDVAPCTRGPVGGLRGEHQSCGCGREPVVRHETRPVLRKVLDDSPIQYLFGYLVLGLFAILLATVSVSAGVWGAVAFLAPLALARLTFLQTERLTESGKRLQEKNDALVNALGRMSEERRDERMVDGWRTPRRGAAPTLQGASDGPSAEARPGLRSPP